MRRLLVILLILPSLAFAEYIATNAVSSGNWTSTATWVSSIVPTQNCSAVITGATITCNSAGYNAFSNLTIASDATLSLSASSSDWFFSGTVDCSGVFIGRANIRPQKRVILRSGGVFTNGTWLFSEVGNSSTNVLASHSNAYQNVTISLSSGGAANTNYVFTVDNANFFNPTLTLTWGSWRFTNATIVIGSLNSSVVSSSCFVTNSTIDAVAAAAGLGQNGSANSITAIDSTFISTNTGGSFLSTITNTLTRCKLVWGNRANAITMSGTWSLDSATTIIITNHAAVFTPITIKLPTVILHRTTLGGALTATTVSNITGTLTTAGNSITADSLVNSGTLLLSNATVLVTSMENSGVVSQQTSTIQFGLDSTQGTLSNVPSAFNLASSFSGKSIKIISNLTVTSTASFSTSASSNPGIISGAPCLLTLSNAGTAFGYGLSNIGVAAYRPLYTWGGVTDRKTATGNVQQVGKYQIIQ